MPVDYDAPRTSDEDEIETESLQGLQAAAESKQIDDTDDGEIVEPFDIPLADLTGEELEVDVIPVRDNEFTCGECFLVLDRKLIAEDNGDGFPICRDCI